MSEDMALRILETGLHAFLVDLVDAAGRAQVDIAHDAGLSAKHVSQMLNGRVDGSLTAWTKVLRAAYVIPPGERRGCAPKVFRGGVQGCEAHGPEAGWPCRVTSPGKEEHDDTGDQ